MNIQLTPTSTQNRQFGQWQQVDDNGAIMAAGDYSETQPGIFSWFNNFDFRDPHHETFRGSRSEFLAHIQEQFRKHSTITPSKARSTNSNREFA